MRRRPRRRPPVYVRPIESGLRIREMPRDGKSVGMAHVTTVLRALEPREIALDKIGVQGEWLHVANQTGVEGYVAAWLVEETEPPIPGRAPRRRQHHRHQPRSLPPARHAHPGSVQGAGMGALRL
ncbi:MAG: hypothetical protein HND48_18510 [Chloroflexi bacterium]|nr:hypothetical protein [Chloroflexota bacterium]